MLEYMNSLAGVYSDYERYVRSAETEARSGIPDPLRIRQFLNSDRADSAVNS